MKNKNKDKLINIAKVLNDNNWNIISMIYKTENGLYSTMDFKEIQPEELGKLYIELGKDLLQNLDKVKDLNLD